MADQKLTAEQQAKLSQIMATPVPQPAPVAPVPASQQAAQSIPLVSSPVIQGPAAPQATSQTTNYNFVNTTTPIKKGNSLLMILFVIIALVVIAGYTVFWLNYFNLIKLF